MIFFDSETVGRHGVPILFQYAVDDGPVVLWDIWTNPARKTLELIEWICEQEFCGFNIAFDWFHLCKIYTMLRMIGPSDFPEDKINELAYIEEQARFSNICLRPKAALDLMLVARRGKFQALMPRDPIRIKRVPRQLARRLASHLTRTVAPDPVFFAKSRDGVAQWKVYDRENRNTGKIDEHFQDVVLTFRASGALKALAKHCNLRGSQPEGSSPLMYKDVDIDKCWHPQELGYAPFALAVTPKGPPWVRRGKWGSSNNCTIRSWPAVIREHILHWGYNERARTYGTDDVLYTRGLHKQEFPDAKAGDRDSELAIQVAAARWSGFAIDIPALQEVRADALTKINNAPRDARKAYQYITEGQDPLDTITFTDKGTGKAVLIEVIESKDWDGTAIQQRCKAVKEAREAKKLVEVVDKLIRAGRLHADFNVTGALSNRMSGTGGINATGIDHSKPFRRCFLFADPDKIIDGQVVLSDQSYCSGDFDSFELSIAAVVFDDNDLTRDLTPGPNQIKLHSLMGSWLSGLTYEEVNASKGTTTGRDWYDTGKKGDFLLIYGGDENTFKSKLGIDPAIGLAAVNKLNAKYKGIKRFGDTVELRHAALKQRGGIGTRIDWIEPKEYVESFLGFKRFFTLEYQIARALFELAQNVPKDWKQGEGSMKVSRSAERIQTAGGATCSAMYGAAFQLCAAIVRAAKNHEVQSPGAEITKELQFAIWNHQPRGIGPWIVKPMQVHDELNVVVKKGYETAVSRTVDDILNRFRSKIPLIAMEFKTGLKNWSEK